MEVEFLEQFSKDLDAISQKSVKSGLAKLIDRIDLAQSLSEISQTKKLNPNYAIEYDA